MNVSHCKTKQISSKKEHKPFPRLFFFNFNAKSLKCSYFFPWKICTDDFWDSLSTTFFVQGLGRKENPTFQISSCQKPKTTKKTTFSTEKLQLERRKDEKLLQILSSNFENKTLLSFLLCHKFTRLKKPTLPEGRENAPKQREEK